jgi:hypothetical protein
MEKEADQQRGFGEPYRTRRHSYCLFPASVLCSQIHKAAKAEYHCAHQERKSVRLCHVDVIHRQITSALKTLSG